MLKDCKKVAPVPVSDQIFKITPVHVTKAEPGILYFFQTPCADTFVMTVPPDHVPQAWLMQVPSQDHPPPANHFGAFSMVGLQELAGRLGQDIGVFLARPHGAKVRKGDRKTKSHCVVPPPLTCAVTLLAVHCKGLFYIMLVLRDSLGWKTELEAHLQAQGRTLLQFFQDDLKPCLQPQKRSTVDYSDPRALVSYGWCYFVSWYNGCCHKKSFVKDKKQGNCLTNPFPNMLGLKKKHSLSPSLLDMYRHFLKSIAFETGGWVECFLPGTTEIMPPSDSSCLQTPHFTSFTLAFDAKQFLHRDHRNVGFTNIINFCSAPTSYSLGLANYSLEGCTQCTSISVEYRNLTVCSVFSQDHDHFVDREENSVSPDGRVALLFYGHKLTETLHGQEDQIKLWKNVISVREQVLAGMVTAGSGTLDLAKVRANFDKLLHSCKDPKSADTEKGCLDLLAEMKTVKEKRDARKRKRNQQAR